jgi:hypothetical protein
MIMLGEPAFRRDGLLSLSVPALAIMAAWAFVSCAPAPDPIEPAQLPTWVSAYDTSAASTDETEEEHGPSGAMKALDFWGAQRAYPDKTIPDALYGFALDQARALKSLRTRAVDDLTVAGT